MVRRSVIVWVGVILIRPTAISDSDNVSGSHLPSQVKSVCWTMVLYMCVVGQFNHGGIVCKTQVKFLSSH